MSPRWTRLVSALAVALLLALASSFAATPWAAPAEPAQLAEPFFKIEDSLSLEGETMKEYALPVQGTDVPEFLIHVKASTASPPGTKDDIDVYLIRERSVLWRWLGLIGEWWDFYDEEPGLQAGVQYSIQVWRNAEAAQAISFTIALYHVPSVPAPPASITFSGYFYYANKPVNPQYVWLTGIASVLLNFQSSGAYKITLKGRPGTLLYMDAQGPETEPIREVGPGGQEEFLKAVSAGPHFFEVEPPEEGEAAWELSIAGPVEVQRFLEVQITQGCRELDVTVQQSCTFAASATASDGGSPSITYNWRASGGCFTTPGGCLSNAMGQSVEWRPPEGVFVGTFEVVVEASAEGYRPGSRSWVVTVTPEFPEALPLAVVAALTVATYVVRRKKRPPAPSAE